MQELINLLQNAYSGEKAAAYAYQGHAASLTYQYFKNSGPGAKDKASITSLFKINPISNAETNSHTSKGIKNVSS